MEESIEDIINTIAEEATERADLQDAAGIQPDEEELESDVEEDLSALSQISRDLEMLDEGEQDAPPFDPISGDSNEMLVEIEDPEELSSVEDDEEFSYEGKNVKEILEDLVGNATALLDIINRD